MKKTILTLAIAALCTSAFAADTVTSSSSTTTTTTTEGAGTISEYTPGSSFVVKETSGPVNYRYGKSVTYVTRSGKTLSDDEVRTRVRVGSPVHVHYSNDGDARVISRVVVDED